MTIIRIRSLFLLLVFSTILTSCLSTFEERIYLVPNVTSFGFSAHDTCPDIEDYTFNIDQFNGVAEDFTSGMIYNLDSLPYGSVVNSLLPSINLQSTNGEIYINDNLWDTEDSLDFTNPVVLKNTSYGDRYTKSYTIFVNVHKVNPDSVYLEPLNTSLPQKIGNNKIIDAGASLFDYSLDVSTGLNAFISQDTCKTWISQPVTGLNTTCDLSSVSRLGTSNFVLSTNHQAFTSTNGLNWLSYSPIDMEGNAVTLLKLFGDLSFPTDTLESVLTGLLVSASGDTCFASSSNGTDWQIGEKLPINFPFSDYAQIKLISETNVQRLRILGGVSQFGNVLGSVWSTEDGLNWVIINDGTSALAGIKRKNAILFKYENRLVCFGGTNENDLLLNTIRVSPDFGKTWVNAPEDWTFDKLNQGISGSGVYVKIIPDAINDKNREFIYFVGGNNASGASDLVWNAYLYQMIFARR